jgi:hypothetical protein
MDAWDPRPVKIVAADCGVFSPQFDSCRRHRGPGNRTVSAAEVRRGVAFVRWPEMFVPTIRGANVGRRRR